MISRLSNLLRNAIPVIKQTTTFNTTPYILYGMLFIIIFTILVLSFNLSTSDTISLLNATSSLVISAIAIYGLENWKTQKSWERKVKAAEDFILLFYKSREAFDITNRIQNRIDFVYKKNTPFIKIAENTISRKEESINSFSSIFSELESRKYEFKIILGNEASDAIYLILETKKKLLKSFERYLDISKELSETLHKANIPNEMINGEPAKGKYLALADHLNGIILEIEKDIFANNKSLSSLTFRDIETTVKSIQERFIQK